MLSRTPPPPGMPDRWNTLAIYNAERSRGIVHTAEYDEMMATWQRSFDREQAQQLTATAYQNCAKRRWWRRG